MPSSTGLLYHARVRLVPIALVLFSLSRGASSRAAEAPRITVAVDLGALDEGSYRRLDALKLEERVLLRLVQEGFAVVKPSASPLIVLRLQAVDNRVTIACASPGRTEQREVTLSGLRAGELDHLEIAQKIVELARAARVAAAPAPQPPTTPVSLAATAPPAAARSLEVALGAAGLLRTAGPDPLFRLDVRLGATGHGTAVRVGAGFAPASRASVTVREWTAQVGVGYRLAVSPRLATEAALALGTLVHTFAVAEEGAAVPSGARFDLLASAPLELCWLAARPLGLCARVAPGLAGRGRRHDRGADVLWRRGAWRLEAGCAAVARW